MLSLQGWWQDVLQNNKQDDIRIRNACHLLQFLQRSFRTRLSNARIIIGMKSDIHPLIIREGLWWWDKKDHRDCNVVCI